MESLSCTADRMPLVPCNKRREGDFTCPDDHISQLPDEILVNILSCLSMKEAAKTTILSSRWRYLWNFFIGCLNFEKPLTMAYLEAKARFGLEGQPLARERLMFMSWVNQVLASHQGQLMEGLRICFDVDYTNNDIDKWVQFALEKKVQKLELDFSGVRYDCYVQSSDQYTFPSHLLRYSSFRSLTSLRLAFVGVSGEVLEHLLSYCPVEVLSVKESFCLTSLKLFGPSLKLKYLELYVAGLKDLEIHLPNLISFKYDWSVTVVSFRNVPNLVDVSFGYYLSDYIMNNLCQLNSFLVQLKSLNVRPLLSPAPNKVPRNFTKLSKLRYLEFRIAMCNCLCLLPCALFLKVCPSLHKLKLEKLGGAPIDAAVRTLKDHPYLSLTKLSVRVVELVGFEGLADAEFMTYLIESAELLETITIDSCSPYWRGTLKESRWRETEKCKFERQLASKLAAKFPSVQFVIA